MISWCARKADAAARLLGLRCRTFRYRLLFRRMGRGCSFADPVRIRYPHNVSFGDHVHVNNFVEINARAPVTIGSHVHLSSHCQIVATSLNLKEHYASRSHLSAPIVIGDGVWICAGSIVGQGVTIGEGSVVAANSVVLEDVPPFSLVGGTPAHVLKRLPHPSRKG